MEPPPWSVLTDLRLERARVPLLSDDPGMTVASPAHEAGFGHAGRFSSSSAAKFGETPSGTLQRLGNRRLDSPFG
ncbi:unnamed protein product [Ectocarpus sp. 12 AP-2014]